MSGFTQTQRSTQPPRPERAKSLPVSPEQRQVMEAFVAERRGDDAEDVVLQHFDVRTEATNGEPIEVVSGFGEVPADFTRHSGKEGTSPYDIANVAGLKHLQEVGDTPCAVWGGTQEPVRAGMVVYFDRMPLTKNKTHFHSIQGLYALSADRAHWLLVSGPAPPARNRVPRVFFNVAWLPGWGAQDFHLVRMCHVVPKSDPYDNKPYKVAKLALCGDNEDLDSYRGREFSAFPSTIAFALQNDFRGGNPVASGVVCVCRIVRAENIAAHLVDFMSLAQWLSLDDRAQSNDHHVPIPSTSALMSA